MRNSLGTVEAVRTFFVPPKRKHVLNEVLESFEDNHIRSLKLITQTRWMERLHGVQRFKELYNIIILALEKIQDFDKRDTSREAMALLATITKGEFVVCMVMLSEIFAFGEPICRQFQRHDLDLGELVKIAGDLKRELANMQENAHDYFKRLFLVAQELA